MCVSSPSVCRLQVRGRDQAAALSKRLNGLAADCVCVPTKRAHGPVLVVGGGAHAPDDEALGDGVPGEGRPVVDCVLEAHLLAVFVLFLVLIGCGEVRGVITYMYIYGYIHKKIETRACLDDGLVGVGHGPRQEAHEREGQHLVLEAQLQQIKEGDGTSDKSSCSTQDTRRGVCGFGWGRSGEGGGKTGSIWLGLCLGPVGHLMRRTRARSTTTYIYIYIYTDLAGEGRGGDEAVVGVEDRLCMRV